MTHELSTSCANAELAGMVSLPFVFSCSHEPLNCFRDHWCPASLPATRRRAAPGAAPTPFLPEHALLHARPSPRRPRLPRHHGGQSSPHVLGPHLLLPSTPPGKPQSGRSSARPCVSALGPPAASYRRQDGPAAVSQTRSLREPESAMGAGSSNATPEPPARGMKAALPDPGAGEAALECGQEPWASPCSLSAGAVQSERGGPGAQPAGRGGQSIREPTDTKMLRVPRGGGGPTASRPLPRGRLHSPATRAPRPPSAPELRPSRRHSPGPPRMGPHPQRPPSFRPAPARPGGGAVRSVAALSPRLRIAARRSRH